MKKILLSILCISMIASTQLMGQGAAVGLKAGLNFANQDFADSDGVDFSGRTGFHFGAYGKLMITGGFGIQPEVYYSTQGSSFEQEFLGQVISGSSNTNYLQVPILLRVGFLKFFNVHAGPQFALLLKSESEFEGVVEDAKEFTKSSDFGIAAGIGVELPLGLTGSIRYVKGISDINDTDDGVATKNNIFQISVGFNLIGVGD